MRSIDLICPVYREEDVIEPFHARLSAALTPLADRYTAHIIYVIDPSSDRTETILSDIYRRDSRVEVLVMSRRFGHQAALIAGIERSHADAVIMLDSDLQHPPELITQLVAHWEEGAEIVQAVRKDGSETGFLKRWTSRWFYQLLLRLGALDLPAGASDYRLLSKRVVEIIRTRFPEQNPFLRGLVAWVGFNVAYVPYSPARRQRGRSKYTTSTLITFGLNGICSFSKVPLRFCVGAGLAIAALSFIAGFVEVLLYALGTTSAPGWPSLIAALCFLGGVQLFFLGVIGEYIGLTFDEVKARPRYLVDRQYSAVQAPIGGDPGTSRGRRTASASVDVARELATSSELSRSDCATLAARGGTGDQLDALVTGRSESLFSSDLETSRNTLFSNLSGRRVLIVGGGGSIGAATVGLVTEYAPAALHVVDQNENYLAELARELRGRPNGLPDLDFRTLPLDYGSPTMERFLMAVAPYDVVLNFAALKHVRSEKDIYSVLQMFDTNIVRHIRFKRWLAGRGHGSVYFAVSTDKAADPASLMGASKRLMEDLIFSIAAEHSRSITSARFANVAFSNGSLLQGFCHRLAKRQPLAVPRATRRYFISHREAAELCLLAAFQIPTRHIAVPRVNEELQLQLLEDIASRLLTFYGLVAVPYTDEVRARRDVERLAARSQWPLVVTPLDTSGERSYERFVGQGETTSDCGLSAVLAVPHVPSGAVERGLFDQLDRWVNDPHISVGKVGIVDSIKTVLSNFCHADSDRNLDQRL